MSKERVRFPEAAGGGGSELWSVAAEGRERGTLVLGHGAGTAGDHPTLRALAGVLAEAGFASVRFDFPYRARGKGPPDRIPKLVASMRAVLEHVRATRAPKRVLVGGHSMGGRVAAQASVEEAEAANPVAGVVLFAYPLHPPKRPDAPRDEVLRALRVPTLWISGTRDPFCTPEVAVRVRRSLSAGVRVVELEGADHGYAVPRRSGRTQADVLADVRDALRAWAREALR